MTKPSVDSLTPEQLGREVAGHPTTCPGPVECWGYEPSLTRLRFTPDPILATAPDTFPTLITYARCPTCGYADVTVDMPDGKTQTVLLVNAMEPGRLPL